MDRVTILVADDADRYRDQLVEMLMRRGYHVVTAGDAEELQAALEFMTPDAIITDLFLPGMSALTLEQRLALRERGILLAVIVSNRTEASIVRRSIDVPVLPRTFDATALADSLATLRNALPLPRRVPSTGPLYPRASPMPY